MRIYLAGYYNGKSSEYTIGPEDYPWVLESYHYIGNQRFVDLIRADAPRKIFLDSGAFSAFSKGANIVIDEYADFINRNQDIVAFSANLDDLARDKEQAAKNSAANLKTLESLVPKGMYVVPVFHCRENTKWLKALVDKYEFIALGGMVPESSAFLRVWLDELWGDLLTKPNGEPRLKVHGFGLTAFDLMMRYPWFSVDSTSWVLTGRFGSIMMSRTSSGVARYRMLVSMAFRPTDLPVPVDPAMRRCGIFERSSMSASPEMFLPISSMNRPKPTPPSTADTPLAAIEPTWMALVVPLPLTTRPSITEPMGSRSTTMSRRSVKSDRAMVLSL